MSDLPAIEPSLILRIVDLQENLKGCHDEVDIGNTIARKITCVPGVMGCAVCIEGTVHFTRDLQGVSEISCKPTLVESGDSLFIRCADECPIEAGNGLRRYSLRVEDFDFGGLFIEVEDEKTFSPVEPLVKGLADYVAICIKSGRVAKRLKETNSILEAKIQEKLKALKESEEMYRTVFEDVGVGIGISSSEGEVIAMNKAMSKITGYSLEEFRGVNIQNVYVDLNDRKRLYEVLERKGKAENFEVLLKKRSGEKYWANICVVPIKYNKRDAFLTSVVDITEMKRAEEALRDSETRYRTLFENANDAIFMMDEKVFLECNDATITMFGCDSKDDILGHSPWEFSPKKQPDGQDSRGKAIKYIRKALSGEPQRFYWKHSKKDGTEFDAEVSLNRMTVSGKTFLQAIVRDVTERKKAEEERVKLEQQFHQIQRLESIGRLAGGVAHDYNNMLNVIIGYAELALEKVDKSDSIYDDLQEILKAAKRSSDVTRQLLAFASKQAVAPKVLDINSTVEAMLKMLRRLIGEDVELIWQPGSDVWKIRIDPSQVSQILANLCINARDAIKESNGKIVIETRNVVIDGTAGSDQVKIDRGEYVLLSITDNGCGMDGETISRLFEPFFTTKELGKGTGLGLSTVYGIVKQNGGFIDVRSKPGKGTSFKIYLPRFRGTTGEVEDEAMQVPRGSGETILVVEDEESILRLTERILKGLGYNVIATKSPIEALEIAKRRGDIELLITDVVMPEMHGSDLAKRIVGIQPSVKCLFMSGYTADAMVHRGILEGGANFIKKPFLLMELALKVRMALSND